MSMNQSDANSASGVLYMLAHQPSTSDVQKQSLLRVSKHLDEQIARMNQPLFNPSAFPVLPTAGELNAEPGMSLRDYFAAKAAPALLRLCQQDAHEGRDYLSYCAGLSYKMADAMLKKRDK